MAKHGGTSKNLEGQVAMEGHSKIKVSQALNTKASTFSTRIPTEEVGKKLSAPSTLQLFRFYS